MFILKVPKFIIYLKSRVLFWLYNKLYINIINRDQVSQLVLMNQYKYLASVNLLPRFEDCGFKAYSQTDEDGYLLYIFSLIGMTNKKVVEMCSGVGVECNAANLMINHGWKGLLFDGDRASIQAGKWIFGRLKSTMSNPPQLVHAWITAENVNELISSQGFRGEIDLLSIDVDGIDYWLWKAITCISPRVVILEYNNYWGLEKSVTVPYSPDFVAKKFNRAFYCGASLIAFVKLGKQLNYRLIGCNSGKYNAFFIRNDIDEKFLPEIDPSLCLKLNENLIGIRTEQNYKELSQFPWEEV